MPDKSKLPDAEMKKDLENEEEPFDLMLSDAFNILNSKQKEDDSDTHLFHIDEDLEK